MKILIMVPPYIDKKEVSGSRFDIAVEDLGIEYISSYLNMNGYTNIMMLHCPIENITIGKYDKILKEYKPDIVGISISFESTDYLGGIEIARHTKRASSQTKVFAGGHTATFLYKKLMQECQFIDFIVFGEGEVTTLDLIKTIENKKDIATVKGIAYRLKNEILVTEKRNLINDLNILPFPDRKIYNVYKPEYALIETSRGCWGKCKFCSVPAFFSYGIGKIWRTRKADSIVKEIEDIISVWGIRKFDFIDDNFLGNGIIGKEKLYRFYLLVKEKKLNIEFNIACRVEAVNLSDLSLLKEIGLKKIYIGIESGSNTTLKRYGKNVTKEENRNAINVVKQLEIDAKLCLIIFDPWTTSKELSETIDFLIEMNCNKYFHWTSILNSYKPYNGTEMQKKLYHEYRLLDQSGNFNYTIYDQKVNEIRNICRYVSGAVKYFYECIKNNIELSSEFLKLDLFLSKPLLKYLQFLLSQEVQDLKDNYFYIRIFYRILFISLHKVSGGDIFEKIELYLYSRT